MKRLAVLPILLLPLAASAVVATTSKAQPAAAFVGWSGVGQMDGGSAVAIGSHLVLTASHVGAGDFILGGLTYHMIGSAYAPSAKGTTVDLTLVTVAETLPSWYTLASSVKKGATVTMVGYGGTGVVDGKGKGYVLEGGGGERSGTNKISSTETTKGRGPTMRAALKKAGDAALTNGDSGGGWFVNGQLVGISDFTYTTKKKATAYAFTKSGDFGSGAIDLTNATLSRWLSNAIASEATVAPALRTRAQAVPEPSALAALGVGALGLIRRRKAR